MKPVTLWDLAEAQLGTELKKKGQCFEGYTQIASFYKTMIPNSNFKSGKKSNTIQKSAKSSQTSAPLYLVWIYTIPPPMLLLYEWKEIKNKLAPPNLLCPVLFSTLETLFSSPHVVSPVYLM